MVVKHIENTYKKCTFIKDVKLKYTEIYSGLAGADLENLVNEAALLAAKIIRKQSQW